MGLFTPSIEKLTRRDDIEGLVGLLGHPNSNLRYGAEKAIKDLGDPRSVDVLLQAFPDLRAEDTPAE
jgi:HEAT repeat protein